MTNNKNFDNEYWDRLATSGEDASVIDPLDKRGFKNQYISLLRNNAIISALKPSSRNILDFGCGSGGLTQALSASGRNVTGIDISSKLLKLAKNRRYNTETTFLEYSGYPIPVESKKFDAVTIYAVLQYMQDIEYLKSIILEIHRVLNDRGELIFLEQCRQKTHIESDGYKIQRSPSEIAKIATNAGFTVKSISIQRYGRFPLLIPIKFGLINKKMYPRIAKFEKTLGTIFGMSLPFGYTETLFCLSKTN